MMRHALRSSTLSGGFVSAAAWLCLCLAGCASPPPPAPPAPPPPKPAIDVEVYRRAESDRADRLEREISRLRTDLRRAEEALVAAESGLRGSHTRADAVSSLAEGRIEVERAAGRAPWRRSEAEEAGRKLDEAERQVQQGHFGAALFFVYRARRIADELQQEADQVERMPDALFISGRRVNLRAGPTTDDEILTVLTRGTPVFPEQEAERWVLVRSVSGSVGWVHASLVRPR